jgi:hypothetical protein
MTMEIDMKRTLLKNGWGAAGILFWGAFAISAHAQSVQPGLWEFRSDMKIPGQPDMAAQMAQMQKQIASLPPETRKAMEQQLAAMGMGVGQQGGIRVCFGPEQTQQPIKEGHQDGTCTYTNVSRSGNTWKGRMVCTDPRSEGDFTTTLHSAKHFTTEAALRSAKGTMQMKSEARHVSADCGAIRPAGKR